MRTCHADLGSGRAAVFPRKIHPRIKSEGVLFARLVEGFVRPSTNRYYLLSLFLPARSPLWEPALIPVVVPDFILLDFILRDFILVW